MSEQSNDGNRPGDDQASPGPDRSGDWAAPAPGAGPTGWVPGAELPGFDEAAPGQGPHPGTVSGVDPYGDRGSGSTSAPAPVRPRREPAGTGTGGGAPSDEIRRYAVHRSRGPVVAVAVLVVVILVVMAVLALRRPAPEQDDRSASPSVTSRASTPGSSESVVGAIPVESGSFTGTWQINSSSWDSTGLTIDMTITSTTGSLAFSMFAIDNVNTGQVEGTGEMSSGTVGDQQTMQGTVRFDKDRNDTTIVLANAGGRQITALTVPA